MKKLRWARIRSWGKRVGRELRKIHSPGVLSCPAVLTAWWALSSADSMVLEPSYSWGSLSVLQLLRFSSLAPPFKYVHICSFQPFPDLQKKKPFCPTETPETNRCSTRRQCRRQHVLCVETLVRTKPWSKHSSTETHLSSGTFGALCQRSR